MTPRRAPIPAVGRPLGIVRGVSTRSGLIVVALAVAAVVRLPYLLDPLNGRTQPDSSVYVGMLHDLLHGRGFATGGEFRTPGYPLLLAVLNALPGPLGPTTVVFQHVLGIAFVGTITWATWRFFGRGPAVFVAALAALSPVLVDLESDVLPDLVFGVVATVGAIVLADALTRPETSLRRFLLAGAIFGVAALVKPAGQAFAAAALASLLVEWRRPRRGLLQAAAVAVAMVAVVSPWLVRNGWEYGDVRMSIQDGPNLWLREFDYDKRPFPSGSAETRLAQRLYVHFGGPHPGITGTYQTVYVALVHRYGYSPRRAAALQRRLAVKAIKAAPQAYVHGTANITARLAAFVRSDANARDHIQQKARLSGGRWISTAIPEAAFSVSQVLLDIWFWLSIAVLAAITLLYRTPRRVSAAAVTLALVWLSITVATAAAGFPDPRYADPWMPLLWVLGAAGALRLIGALIRIGRSRRLRDPFEPAGGTTTR